MANISQESWYKCYWRPAFAWLYFLIIAFDFILAPLILAIIAHDPKAAVDWMPMSLKQNGMLHIALAPIVGVYAYMRSKEKSEATQTEGTLPSLPELPRMPGT